MPLSVFIDMTISACVTVWSPGPNNILLLSTASKYGVKKNLRLMLGIWTGSLSLMFLSGIFCSTLGAVIPGIQPIMKYIGAAYILYLAWQTYRRSPPSENGTDKEPSCLMGLMNLVMALLLVWCALRIPGSNPCPLLHFL